MSAEARGRCPRCETPIHTAQDIIAYKTTSGVRVYSECPGCHAVVHPE
jgi:uncharacterized protein with PIN domain